jgi:hypothetical protein
MNRIRRLLFRFLLLQALTAAPLALVKLGLSRSGLTRVAEEADEVRMASLSDGLVFDSRASAFRGGGIAWLFGGLVLDLRHATIAAEGADLSLVTIMGGSVIRVPPDWPIEIEQRAVLGGNQPPSSLEGTGPALRLKVLTVLGGLNVQRQAPKGPGGQATSNPDDSSEPSVVEEDDAGSQ